MAGFLAALMESDKRQRIVMESWAPISRIRIIQHPRIDAVPVVSSLFLAFIVRKIRQQHLTSWVLCASNDVRVI
jgi:hypothetical protein